VGPRVFAAIDLGASSGRVVAGVLERDRIGLRVVERFAHGPIEQDGHLRWNLTKVYGQVSDGLRRIPDAESVGIDGWGVDYGILDQDGDLLAEPVAYRDGRTAEVVKDVHQLIPPAELYTITGTQILPFNTVYQIVAEQSGPLWTRAACAVLVPDLVAYWLTGELKTEVTNASTTGLLNIADTAWSTELFSRLGIPIGLFPPIERPGTLRGTTDWGLPVVSVGSHDTASAVVGVPAATPHFAFISSGTWSLVGLELEEPVVTEDVVPQWALRRSCAASSTPSRWPTRAPLPTHRPWPTGRSMSSTSWGVGPTTACSVSSRPMPRGSPSLPDRPRPPRSEIWWSKPGAGVRARPPWKRCEPASALRPS